MRSNLVSLFKIDPHRSLEPFDALMGAWKGVLISDDYALYRRRAPKMWQACLVHLIRAAKKHSEAHDPDIAKGRPVAQGAAVPRPNVQKGFDLWGVSGLGNAYEAFDPYCGRP